LSEEKDRAKAKARPKPEEELARLAAEVRTLESLSDALRDMVIRIQALITELGIAGRTLDGISGQEGAEVLIPIGAGSLLRASLKDVDKVIVSLGADVAIEVDVEKAKEIIGDRLAEAQKALKDYLARLGEVERALEARRERIRALLEARGRAGGAEEGVKQNP